MKIARICVAGLLTVAAFPADAATITVTTDADSGPGSLREAVATANLSAGPHVIDFDAEYTITLASTLPTIDPGTSITILGIGWDRTIIDGGNPPGGSGGVRAFIVEGALTLDGVGIQNCYHAGEGGAVFVASTGSFQFLNSRAEKNWSDTDGGALFNDGSWNSLGSLIVRASLIFNNQSEDRGGGIYTKGTATVEDTTISMNEALGRGGAGIAVDLDYPGGNLVVRRSLFLGNEARDGNGGGLRVGPSFSAGTTGTIENSTFVENEASRGGAISCIDTGRLTIRGVTMTRNISAGPNSGGAIHGDCSYFGIEGSIAYFNEVGPGPNPEDADILGIVDSLGFNLIGATSGSTTILGDTTGNLIGVNPQLGPLADNGGSTKTCALPEDSPAIDAGPPGCGGLTTDQRGYSRPIDGDQTGTAECDMGAFEYHGRLFEDDFESGTCEDWSSTVGELP